MYVALSPNYGLCKSAQKNNINNFVQIARGLRLPNHNNNITGIIPALKKIQEFKGISCKIKE